MKLSKAKLSALRLVDACTINFGGYVRGVAEYHEFVSAPVPHRATLHALSSLGLIRPVDYVIGSGWKYVTTEAGRDVLRGMS